jgi:N-acyl homoserine lactone hydrolase
MHRLQCGRLIAPSSRFEQGGSGGVVAVPVYAWLVHHPRGTVLFDTGLSPELRAGDRVLSYEIDTSPSSTVAAQLAGIGVDPGEVDTVVLSHCHFDHAGGVEMVPNARLVAQAGELAGLEGVGHPVEPIRGEYDVFGDGRVVCIPTPGHTRGHQSLLIRLDDREVVLAADCCYFERTLRGGRLPPFGDDLEQQARSVALLRSMEQAGVHIVPGHDPAAACPGGEGARCASG